MAQRTNEATWLDKYNRWQIKVQKEGERKSFYSNVVGTKGKIECERKADKWLEDNIVDENIRFEKAYNQFLEKVQIRSGTGNYKKHVSIGRNWLLPSLKHKKISSITQNDFQNCIDKAYAMGRSKKTLEHIRASVTAFLKFARISGYKVIRIEDDLLIHRNAPVGKRNIIDKDALKALFAFEPEPDAYHFIYAYQFFVVSGYRRGEVCGLMEKDFDGRNYVMQRSYNEYKEFTDGKTANAQRPGYASDTMMEILEKQRNLKKRCGIISPYLFPNKNNDVMNPKNLTTAWAAFRNEIGTNNTLHEMRHSFTSYLKGKVSDTVMKTVLGHSPKMDTFGIYGHLVEGELEGFANVIDDTFSEIINP